MKLYPWFTGSSVAISSLPGPDEEYHVIERKEQSGYIVFLDASPMIALVPVRYGELSLTKDNCQIYFATCDEGYNRNCRICCVWDTYRSLFGLLFLPVSLVTKMSLNHRYFLSTSGEPDLGSERSDPGWRADKGWYSRIEFTSYDSTVNSLVHNQGPATQTCIKCGYHNEYINPIPGYVCRQCKTRNAMWS